MERGPLQFLETFIPVLIALACLGWVVIRSLQNDDPAHPLPAWVGPFRAAVYLLMYIASYSRLRCEASM